MTTHSPSPSRVLRLLSMTLEQATADDSADHWRAVHAARASLIRAKTAAPAPPRPFDGGLTGRVRHELRQRWHVTAADIAAELGSVA